MTKDEIKSLVAAKIAGQGSMVDVGGGLPTILNEIIDLIPEGGGGESLNIELIAAEDAGYYNIASGETIEDVRSAFLSGIPVIAHYQDDDSDKNIYEVVISCDRIMGWLQTKSFKIE